MLYLILRSATFISHSNYHIFQTVRHAWYKINQNFRSQIEGKHILFTSETPIHTFTQHNKAVQYELSTHLRIT
jgi:hypothetical protein